MLFISAAVLVLVLVLVVMLGLRDGCRISYHRKVAFSVNYNVEVFFDS
jgi:hypothetical protein